ncbi:MAG: nucleoside triphosphate pyrophosphatase [Gammaproteobacteria bacterium]|jgi:septum formation protein|nr:nucleoside triphosphate pyrophosphatase [Gammaproteobacteria bacterium]
MSANFVYLASGSPRRRELLAQIGVPFQVLTVTVDEAHLPGELPDAYVLRLARQKADAGWRARPALSASPVLAADTTVVLDGKILAKPTDRRDGERMLRELGGRTHEVLTAVAVATTPGLSSRTSRSEVTFRAISAAEARDYWATSEPLDKAGGYAIQGGAAVFVADLKGSYSGVMGLPLFETAELLEQAGVPRWSYPR